MTHLSKFFAYTALIASLVLVFSVTSHAQDWTLTNVSSDPTQEFQADFDTWREAQPHDSGEGGVFDQIYRE